jgi:hypothetical protein
MSKTIFQLHDAWLELGDDILETINGLLGNGSHQKRRRNLRDLTTVAMLLEVRAKKRTGLRDEMERLAKPKTTEMEKREIKIRTGWTRPARHRRARSGQRPIGQSSQ